MIATNSQITRISCDALDVPRALPGKACAKWETSGSRARNIQMSFQTASSCLTHYPTKHVGVREYLDTNLDMKASELASIPAI